MISLSFRIPEIFTPPMFFSQAYFAGWGRAPRPTKVSLEGNILTLRPETAESGTLHVPVLHKRFGVLTQSTDTLRQREEPYHLLKELGRGELGRLQRRFFEWQMLGFSPSSALRAEVHQLFVRFGKMVTSDEYSPSTDAQAAELLRIISKMGTKLANQYIEQSIIIRQKNQRRIPIPLGVFANVGAQIDSYWQYKPLRSILGETFQLLGATPSWREVEPQQGKYRWDLVEGRLNMGERLGLKNIIGPILSFESNMIPEWALRKLNERDFLENAALKYAKMFVQLFRDKSQHWVISNRFFSCPSCGFSIGRGIALVSSLAKEVKNAGAPGSVIVGIDQPWGDYYRKNDCPLPLIAIADSLGLTKEIDAFILELNIGLADRSSLPRDPVILGRMIDNWSNIGKRIFVSLSVPSDQEDAEDFADGNNDFSFSWDTQVQQEWANRALLMFFTKRNVQGIFWNQLIDPDSLEHNDPMSYLSSSGLIDAVGKMKPAFRKIASLRKAYLE